MFRPERLLSYHSEVQSGMHSPNHRLHTDQFGRRKHKERTELVAAQTLETDSTMPKQQKTMHLYA
jgi:hypothetical protein